MAFTGSDSLNVTITIDRDSEKPAAFPSGSINIAEAGESQINQLFSMLQEKLIPVALQLMTAVPAEYQQILLEINE